MNETFSLTNKVHVNNNEISIEKENKTISWVENYLHHLTNHHIILWKINLEKSQPMLLVIITFLILTKE